MIRVFLCDADNQNILHQKQMIEKAALENNIPVTIKGFSTGDALEFEISEKPASADIIYIDVQIQPKNGIETAAALRKCGCNSEIIFYTDRSENVFNSFEICPFYYLLKSRTSDDKFEKVFLHAAQRAEKKRTDYFICEFHGVQKLMAIEDIMYFEIWQRIIAVHCYKQNTITFYGKLEDIEKQFKNKGFMRVHRSYVVNPDFINEVSNQYLKLRDGEDVPVGNSYAKNVRHQFENMFVHKV